jgi:hypothetical protein
MPTHDWTRVEPGEYHDFHYSWLTFIKSSLNNGGLPPRYEALTDHTSPPYVPDVVTPYTGFDPPGADPDGIAVATAPRSAVAMTGGGRKKRPAAGGWPSGTPGGIAGSSP